MARAVLLPERFRGGCAFGAGQVSPGLSRESRANLGKGAGRVKRAIDAGTSKSGVAPTLTSVIAGRQSRRPKHAVKRVAAPERGHGWYGVHGWPTLTVGHDGLGDERLSLGGSRYSAAMAMGSTSGAPITASTRGSISRMNSGGTKASSSTGA